LDVPVIASPSPTTFDGVAAHTIEHAAVDFSGVAGADPDGPA
jgi:hypothetical protein